MQDKLSCANCGTFNCSSLQKQFPEFCLTQAAVEENAQSLALYLNDPYICKVAQASAQVEGLFYKQLTRVEEIMEFARRIEAKKIGVATCLGLIEEARMFKRILEHNDFQTFVAVCKVGANDKTKIGVQEEEKVNKGIAHESMCNPILQALVMNKEKTDLNVLVGLCVGHDSLFCKYSQALCTTLVAKDRVLAHNPVGALYTARSYNNQLLAKK